MTLKLFELCGADPERVFSPFCWRIRMALAHKGLEAETVPWRFTEKDANPDMGDSAIVETIGLGGFAMGAAPAVVGFIGAGNASDAARFSRAACFFRSSGATASALLSATISGLSASPWP